MFVTSSLAVVKPRADSMRGLFSVALTCSAMLVCLAAAEGRSGRWKIVPGTKWCGPGTRAKHDDDLGRFAETDRCCREHDKCPEKLQKGTTSHGLTNNGRFTLSHCDCDERFLRCLKKANSMSASIVGRNFFSVWNPMCFKEDYPTVCIKYSFTGRRCVATRKDTSKPKEWQFFSNPVW
ncbi:putative phospholipase A2C isoform X1 [Penaeus vannamei]|uniref:Phospholipase A2 n=1 Tax=Penaeus vannamei TaxID=6689 RepID=A0A423T1H4_PENVA|nr:putative phospholipase A2C isoform X1 [Penaeus vannamei]